MLLYLQHNTADNVRYLSPQAIIGAGDILTTTPGSPVEYVLSAEPQTIMRDGNLKVHLLFDVLGKVDITPFVIRRFPEEQPDGSFQIVDEILSTEGTATMSTTKNQSNRSMDWTFNIPRPQSLETADLILRLIIASTDTTNLTVGATDVTNNTFNSTAHGFINGDRVRFTSVTGITMASAAVNTNNEYFVVEKTNDTFKLALTAGGAALDITAQGTATVREESFLKLKAESLVNARVVEGETQEIDIWTQSYFSYFQRTERIFAFTDVNAVEDVMVLDAETEAKVRSGEIPRPQNSALTRVINKEEVQVPYFSNVNALESVEKRFAVSGIVHGPFTDADPHLTDLEIGDFALPTWDVVGGTGEEDFYKYFELRKREGLDVLTDRLAVHPNIMVPPAIPKLPQEDSSLAVAAEKMFESFEMLKGEEDRFVTGDIFRIFSPGISFSDQQALAQRRVNPRQGFWQLPVGYISNEFSEARGASIPVYYSSTFQFEPFKQSILNKDSSIPIVMGNSLWFLLRHRPVDATLSAFLGQIPGQMVLRKMATSQEEVVVWYWSNVKSPFVVNLYVRNPFMQQPGFRGVNTAMMLG